jgi:hypothetical protein
MDRKDDLLEGLSGDDPRFLLDRMFSTSWNSRSQALTLGLAFSSLDFAGSFAFPFAFAVADEIEADPSCALVDEALDRVFLSTGADADAGIEDAGIDDGPAIGLGC